MKQLANKNADLISVKRFYKKYKKNCIGPDHNRISSSKASLDNFICLADCIYGVITYTKFVHIIIKSMKKPTSSLYGCAQFKNPPQLLAQHKKSSAASSAQPSAATSAHHNSQADILKVLKFPTIHEWFCLLFRV